MHIYYGCNEITKSWTRYYDQCNAIELSFEQDNPPTMQTLNRWRVESPRGFAFIVHTPTAVADGLVQSIQNKLPELSASAKQQWQTTLERAAALAAKAIYLRTPMAVGPNDQSRAFIIALAKDAKENKRTLIWEPEGMWPPEETFAFAKENNIMLAIDPFLWSREEYNREKTSDLCFVLTERASARRKFDQYDLEEMLENIDSAQRLFILCRGRFKWDHVRELRYVLEYAVED